MPLSTDQFSRPITPASANVEPDNVARELLYRALGNPVLLRIPTLIPLLTITIAAMETEARNYLWWLVGLQVLTGCFTALTAHRVKQVIQRGLDTKKAIRIWLTCEAVSGIVWGLMMVPVAQAGTNESAYTIISVSILVTLTAAGIATANAQGLAQALLLGFMLIVAPAFCYYYEQLGLYVVLSIVFFTPTLLWVGMMLRHQARGTLVMEMQNECLSAELTDALRVSESLSKRDNLTGLFNRNEFTRITEELFNRHYGAGLSIIAIDLDHFKLINDEHGHAAGDHALVVAARLMKTHVRASGMKVQPQAAIARWGGEEFLIALANCRKEDALMIAERIRSAFEGYDDKDWPVGLKMTASFGVANWRQNSSLQATINRADEALYRAKAAGRNRICKSTSENEC